MADDPEKPPPKLGEAVLSTAVILFGLLVVWQTTQIRLTPAYSRVGPRVIPYIVGAGLVIIGLWLLYTALTGRWQTSGSADSEDVDLALPTDWLTVGQLAAALLAYLFLLEPAGFVVASTILFTGAAFAMGSRRTARDVIIGLVMALALYIGFTRGLNLQLPAGVLEGIL